MEHGRSHICRLCLAAALIPLSASLPALAQGAPPIDNPLGIPDARQILPAARDAEGVSATLQILVLLTVLTLVPSALILTTSFTRILVVLALLRQAMGTAQLPPGQVMLGLALLITLLVMGPTLQGIRTDALTPYLNNEISQEAALDRAMGHLRTFMYRQIESAENHEDVYLFLEYQRGAPIPLDEKVTLDDVSSTVLIPAFVLSELKVAFVMGFRIYLPFLVIDMVIASILISMGMMMLPPVLVSLPFKLLLFVLADGWHLVTRTLLMSFA